MIQVKFESRHKPGRWLFGMVPEKALARAGGNSKLNVLMTSHGTGMGWYSIERSKLSVGIKGSKQLADYAETSKGETDDYSS